MDVLDFDEWPVSNMGNQGGKVHPLLAQAIETMGATNKVVRFTEKDLVELPNGNLNVLEQRLRTLAQRAGYRLSVLHRNEDGLHVIYARRNPVKRK